LPSIRPDDYFLDLSRAAIGDTAFWDESIPAWIVFRSPIEILQTNDLGEVLGILAKVENHRNSGRWAAGYLTYECASALNPAITTKPSSTAPLMWFALYESEPTFHRELLPPENSLTVEDLTPELELSAYKIAFQTVKQHLAEGHSYQVNFTFRSRFNLVGNPEDFFSDRCGVEPPRHAAYLKTDVAAIASFSPELFFERLGENIHMRPMKGTAPLSQPANDMRHDPKSVAENVMIVDMVRNDLGAICETGSISVPHLLEVERHRNLYQMTSTVSGRSSASLTDLLTAIFPAASVTGAPKVKTCQIIQDLEISPRGIYCGAIGFIGPGIERFSVPIRTAYLPRDGWAEFGVGSGLVWDSEVEAEYLECLLKKDLLLQSGRPWRLVESIPAHKVQEAYVRSRHLDRLSRQAQLLNIPFDRELLDSVLARREPTPLHPLQKVRIELEPNGGTYVEVSPSMIQTPRISATLAKSPVNPTDPNLRLKTTSRSVYQRRLDEHPDFDEVLLVNSRGFLTEFCSGNLVLKLDGRLYTPSREQGALQGISISEMIDRGEVTIRDLTPDDLKHGEAIYFLNAVAGLVPVDFEYPAIIKPTRP